LGPTAVVAYTLMSHALPTPPIVLILGPTAGGKSALAMGVARSLGGECISADSMQVYRGMDLGTAKPSRLERELVPHHLLDLIDPPDDGFTVDHWLELADRAVRDIRGRRRLPIIVGGTNLYVQAFLFGLFDGPPPDEALRARLDAAASDDLRAELERVDPAAAARIHRNDRRRTVRALEVHALTGTPISAHQQQWFNTDHPLREDVRIIGLDHPVNAINRRINARVKTMMAAGLLEEVRRLAAAGPLGRQAREALGYKQLLAHVRGECTLDEAVEQIKIRTRRYAKQQRTWLRRFRAYPGSIWLDAVASSPQMLVEQALAHINGSLGALQSSLAARTDHAAATRTND
jgi:tRNA dimethylallyltransferase